MRYIVLFLLFASNFAAAQAKWYKVFKSKDGTITHYVKYEKTVKNDMHVWLKTTEADKEVKGQDGKTTYEKQGYVVQYMVFHCGSMTADKLEFTLYDGEGKIETEGNDKIYNEKIIRGSAGAVLYNFVCDINQ